MVEAVKIYDFPQEAHFRFAHDAEASEKALLGIVADSYLASGATTVMVRGPEFSFFDKLFSVAAKGIVHSDPPPAYSTQLLEVSKRAENLFGSPQNLDSMIEVIRNVTDKDKGKKVMEEGSVKLTDVMQQLKKFDTDRDFVRAKIGSLIQG